MKMIGRSIRFVLLFLITVSSSFAEITATTDRNQVPMDESISFKISKTGKTDSTALNPKFEAPDFEIMNQFESSQFSSVYINGKFENKSEKSITYILRPLKVGSLKISNISNQGEKAPDITVQVVRETNYQKSAGDQVPSLKNDQRNFFVRAEPSKSKVYKGEQVIVSFYLYRRTKANIRDVMQYPSFEGFIREDLEMPILSGRPEFEAVNLGGVPFERALLAKYAIYPIKTGKLKVDGFSIRADYIPKNSVNEDLMEDPFFQFFSQVTPRTGTSKSDPVSIEVMELPEEGKGAYFTGGVGDFEVTSQLDKSLAKTNSPLTLKVTVKGRGNSSLIEFPKLSWPPEFKFYESQGKSRNLGQGMTEKTFEVILIPQQVGDVQIPPIPFEFFNPSSRSYVQKKTDPIRIRVEQGESAPMVQPTESKEQPSENNPGSPSTTFGNIRSAEFSKSEGTGMFLDQPWWRWVAWAGLLVLLAFLGMIGFDHLKKRSLLKIELNRKKEKMDTFWKELSAEAESASLPIVFEKVSDQLYETLDAEFGITSRSLQLRDLAKILTEQHGLSPEQFKSLASIFEFSEMVRFASQPQSSDPELRSRAQELIVTAKNLCAAVSSKKLDS